MADINYGEKLPTLTTEGYIDNPLLVLEKLFLYFITNDSSKLSCLDSDHMQSLSSVKITANKDVDSVKTELISQLQLLYNPYYQDVEVTCDVLQEGPIDKIYIRVKVLDFNGDSYSIDKDLVYKDGVIANYLDLLARKNIFNYRRN